MIHKRVIKLVETLLTYFMRQGRKMTARFQPTAMSLQVFIERENDYFGLSMPKVEPWYLPSILYVHPSQLIFYSPL